MVHVNHPKSYEIERCRQIATVLFGIWVVSNERI
jgi:hypothetical protein